MCGDRSDERCAHSSACMHPKHLPFEGVRTKHESSRRFRSRGLEFDLRSLEIFHEVVGLEHSQTQTWSGHSKKEAKKIAATSILLLVRGIAVGSSKAFTAQEYPKHIVNSNINRAISNQDFIKKQLYNDILLTAQYYEGLDKPRFTINTGYNILTS
uniref:Uncharacterized protein n=1 Tax=Timema tahoe TaxID=61484 RepID=A0A7R9I9F7_9NEOP|nr:unnamed protein product [Timema tahoe]